MLIIMHDDVEVQKTYQFLHDQYLALVLGPGLSQLCRALNDLRLAGFDLRIRMVFLFADVPPCPKFTFLTLPVLGSRT